jgi:cation-transporting ATPase E
VAIAVVAVNLYSMAAGHGPEAARAASVMTLTLVALGILAQVSRPVTGRRLFVITAMYAGAALLYTVPVFKDFFMLDWPPPPLLAASLAAALGAIPALMLLGRIHDRQHRPATRSASAGGPVRTPPTPGNPT